MTSLLDPYLSMVFKKLHEHGLSYQVVSKDLSLIGVSVSPQALRSWHLRRVAKIAKRTKDLIFNSTDNADSAPIGIQVPVVPSSLLLPSSRGDAIDSVAAQVKGGRTVLSQCSELHAQIKEEERRLSTQPLGALPSYPVRRKVDLMQTVKVMQTPKEKK